MTDVAVTENTYELPVVKSELPATSYESIDYDHFLDCVHCGLCTAACPTYAELGNENDSPRGRIYLMRAVRDGRAEMDDTVRGHLELCLDCRACETACPSGVQYGRIIEPFRVAMENELGEESKSSDWFHRFILFGLFPNRDKLRKWLRPARIAQRLKLDKLLIATGLWKLLPKRLGRMVTLLPQLKSEEKPIGNFLQAEGKRRARVALFTGCVQDVIFQHTNHATARVLQKNGCDVIIPQGQGCCGAIHYHSGAEEEARDLADQNLEAFKESFDDLDAVIINAAGCGAMLKDYGHHWLDGSEEARELFASKVKDVHEFLDELGFIPPSGRIEATATYHDACHLAHAQQIQAQPRNLLRQIPGLDLVELPESELCCGAAGTYNLTQPEMADRLADRKIKNIESTKAQLVLTANTGCLMQIDRERRMNGSPFTIMHPMDLLDLSYRGEQP
ncbi:MAG: (Fe-S)-binding protein [Pirellulales bacterium]|nr:(Fe-S)-binding protein [Pirellulales bacterium]